MLIKAESHSHADKPKEVFFPRKEKVRFLYYLLVASLPCIVYATGIFDITHSLQGALRTELLSPIEVGDVNVNNKALANLISNQCNVARVNELNVCGFNYRIGRSIARGVDLTKFSHVTFTIAVNTPRPTKRVRFQLRNFNPIYASESDSLSPKYMGITVDGFKRPTTYTLPLSEFSVESWWLYNKDIAMKYTGLEFANIVDFVVVHSDLRDEGLYRLELSNVVFTGQLLSADGAVLLSAILMVVFLSVALVRYHRKLLIYACRAEDANEAKSRFLSNMSHEIRTPLNSILGTLQLIQHKQRQDKFNDLVDQSVFSAKSLIVIINDILDFSKIEANQLVLEDNPFSFVKTVDGVMADVRTYASSKDIVISHDIDQGFVDGWQGDSVRIRQILLNLVSNAVKFTDKGQVTIKTSIKHIDDVQHLCFAVIDTGIGMSEEFQALLFERFSQADSSISRKYGGTGLGMAITMNLIELMGGSLEVQSQKGNGTTIEVALPLQHFTLTTSNEPTQTDSSPPDLSGITLLIAEDNQINQAVIEAMIKPTNCKMIFVDNGKHAVEACKAHSFDLVLMDIQMPEMGGEEAFVCIREFNQHIPIIALTANVMQEDIDKYKRLGFDAHIGKPVIVEDLYGKLAHVVDTKLRCRP